MIKYRVWDTVAKEYLDEGAVSINGYGGLAVFDGANVPVATQWLSASSPRFIIEQYTGLEDDSGVEIAVGDIISHDPHWEDGRTVSVVKYDDWNAEFYPFGKSDWSISSEQIKVIGNVHENSKLLGAGDKNVPSKKG